MGARTSIDKIISKFEKPFVVYNEIRLDKSALLKNIEVLSKIGRAHV